MWQSNVEDVAVFDRGTPGEGSVCPLTLITCVDNFLDNLHPCIEEAEQLFCSLVQLVHWIRSAELVMYFTAIQGLRQSGPVEASSWRRRSRKAVTQQAPIKAALREQRPTLRRAKASDTSAIAALVFKEKLNPTGAPEHTVCLAVCRLL